jgi:GH24 family phage-related lysozyme (muramidase)
MADNIIYTGALSNFATGPFLQYCKKREGYRLDVYNDSLGNATVGIGHKLPDGTAIGSIYTAQQVADLFTADYNRLNIEAYVTEGAYTLNQQLCIGHFIWMHGEHAYAKSDYRQHWLHNDYPNEADMQNYLVDNWDIANPGLQAVNAKDCAVAYSPTLWSAGYLDQALWDTTDIFPSISGWAQDNAVFLVVLAVAGILLLIWALLFKN